MKCFMLLKFSEFSVSTGLINSFFEKVTHVQCINQKFELGLKILDVHCVMTPRKFCLSFANICLIKTVRKACPKQFFFLIHHFGTSFPNAMVSLLPIAFELFFSGTWTLYFMVIILKPCEKDLESNSQNFQRKKKGCLRIHWILLV